MAHKLKSKVIVAGLAEGVVLKLQAPVSFWGGISSKDGRVIQIDHPDKGVSVSATILALPGLIGSSSSSAVLLELLYKGIAPKAIVMPEIDAILALGDLVAEEMNYPTIPILQMPLDGLQNGQHVIIEEDGTVLVPQIQGIPVKTELP